MNGKIKEFLNQNNVDFKLFLEDVTKNHFDNTVSILDRLKELNADNLSRSYFYEAEKREEEMHTRQVS